ncbi:hypothetical protein FPOA_06758 [Fusarium poae]|uniref:Uncharacterized protein n=1 Tax=Fusarium poae TaxID=36050 RepID=A0A1B8AIT4_FUSPO|nr:hypothetical protein FPOA_06758 [Fusarium poae]
MPRSERFVPNDEKEIEAQHHNFLSVMRIFNDSGPLAGRTLPKWYLEHTTFTHVRHKKRYPHPIKVTNQLTSQRQMGILINMSWPASCRSWNCMAQYLGFTNFQDTAAYIDVVVPDLVHEYALFIDAPEDCRDILEGNHPFSLA